MPLGTAEVSGVASLDNVAFHEGTGTTFTCPITTSGSNELILSFAAAQYTGSQTVSFTESGSWAIAQSNQGEELSITTGFAMISQSFTTPGTYTPTVDSAAVPTLSIVQKMGQTNNFFPLSETLTPTAGNSILVSVGVEPTTNSVTVTDTQSNSYSLVVSQPADGSHPGAYIFRTDGVTSASNTITVHCTSAIGGIEVYELPPLDAVDQTGASYFSSGTTPALPAVITTAPGEFCLCVGDVCASRSNGDRRWRRGVQALHHQCSQHWKLGERRIFHRHERYSDIYQHWEQSVQCRNDSSSVRLYWWKHRLEWSNCDCSVGRFEQYDV